ncbi:ubiquitin-associated protein 1 [Battus philenor]|uniref:ubiquitin-associated protein 1 n=1 Tax=Battus philenor TaxID=42288 RepID=UPI0035D09B11
MSHFGDYMDGVPVKISEKYKRPPRIELPSNINKSVQRAQNVVDDIKYCSTFERNVLSKVKELRSAKETKRNERKHRLQLLEEAKQKKLDAIAAAEAEEKLKQLSVSEVSYPSTDEISAISSDEKIDKNCETSPVEETVLEADKAILTEPYVATAESQPDILQPVQVQTTYHPSLLDDPDPLQELKMNIKVSKVPQYNNVDMLTFRDFENDTSSPFDNVELKTINDMELLAQVLQRDSTTNCPNQGMYVNNQTYTGYTNCATQAQIEGITYLPNSYMEQTIQGPSAAFTSSQHFPVSNGYYLTPENTCDNVPVDNVNMYNPNYQYFVPSQTVPPDLYYGNSLPTTSQVTQINNDSNLIPQPYYFQYPQAPVQYTNTSYNTNETYEKPVEDQVTATVSQNTIKSRSRSVPDIMKELNEELASAKQRASERSCNASPAPKPAPQPEPQTAPQPTLTSEKKERKERRKRKVEIRLPNPYIQLPVASQRLCKRIHAMGFPLERVARICVVAGDNERRIIECLLIMGELLDLGFSEARVSAALARHKFDKEKALDDLVS